MRRLIGAGRIHLDEHGKPLRSVGISLDVTERRALEEQYQQAQKMEAIGRLAGGVAHDFNNLLTAILGYCELLLSDLATDDAHYADIAEIQKAGLRAAGLTRQLLAFSRKQIIEPTLLDLNLVVTEMQAMLGRLIGEDVKIVLTLRADLAGGEGGSGSGGTDHHESRGECPGRHAKRRLLDDRDRQRQAGRQLSESLSVSETGSLCEADRGRHRNWYVTGGASSVV